MTCHKVDADFEQIASPPRIHSNHPVITLDYLIVFPACNLVYDSFLSILSPEISFFFVNSGHPRNDKISTRTHHNKDTSTRTPHPQIDKTSTQDNLKTVKLPPGHPKNKETSTHPPSQQ
jgi:hypothetical protein